MFKFIVKRINKKNANTCIYCKQELDGNSYSTLHLRNNLIIKICDNCKKEKAEQRELILVSGNKKRL